MRLDLNRRSSLHAPIVPGAAFAVAMLVGLLAMAVSGAWNAGFSGADEPAHFLNSWFIASYVQNAFGSDPMAYATEYYLHYPKISIGHWPPGLYALLSPFLLVLPATPATAFGLNLAISSLPALFAAMILLRLEGKAAALAGAFACAMTPVAIEAYAFFMLDQAVAAAALAATLLWAGYVHRPRAWTVIGFGVLAAGAVLIKGNGWLLLFVPPIHLLLTGRWSVLRSLWPWVAALLAALLVGPWYWLTAGISADGFNHAPGLRYAWRAFGFNVAAITQSIGILPLLLALWGGWSEWRRRAAAPDRWNLAAGCIALVLATLILQSLVPVDLDPRYMAPALPPLIVLALLGACAFLPAPGRGKAMVAAVTALAIALPGIAHLAEREPKVGFRLEEAARFAPSEPSAWVIDGTTGAEGAFIAAMAVRDPELRSYSVRSSRLLSQSDFMGAEYRLTVSTPGQVLERLKTLGVEGVVVVRPGGKPAFPHSLLLRRALLLPGSPYRRIAAFPHRNRAGSTEIFQAAEAVRLNEPLIRAAGVPAKAGTLSR